MAQPKQRHRADRWRWTRQRAIAGWGDAVSLTGTQLTYDVLRAEHFSPVSATGNQVDIASAWFKQSASNCLLVGATVELKGTVESATNTLIVNVISVERGCAKLANVSD